MTVTKTYSGREPVRVNKWLAQAGICSRREAETLIEKGLVSIDGAKVQDLGRKISPGQTLTVAGKGIKQLENKSTLIIHKPVGYVSAQPEGDQIPAARLIRRETQFGREDRVPPRHIKLAPLGRLDQDSRGLLILSEDGVLAKAIIGPENAIEKEYLVKVRGHVLGERLEKLRFGLELDGRKLRRASVRQIKGPILNFVLREGRNRQIRRMCELVGLEVVDLMRIRIGSLRLGDLPEGQWRHMAPLERQELLAIGRQAS